MYNLYIYIYIITHLIYTCMYAHARACVSSVTRGVFVCLARSGYVARGLPVRVRATFDCSQCSSYRGETTRQEFTTFSERSCPVWPDTPGSSDLVNNFFVAFAISVCSFFFSIVLIIQISIKIFYLSSLYLSSNCNDLKHCWTNFHDMNRR